ncbi:hypothetical protein V6Z12_D11G187600 [Gossypium hirsutum]
MFLGLLGLHNCLMRRQQQTRLWNPKNNRKSSGRQLALNSAFHDHQSK